MSMFDDYYEGYDDEEPDFQDIQVTSREAETDKAILFNTPKGQTWIPKSVIENEEAGYIFVPDWFEIKYI